MARYFFHTIDGRSITDEQGSELANQGEARIEAVRLLGELLQNEPDQFWQTGSFTMTVANGDRLTLFTIDVCATDAPAS